MSTDPVDVAESHRNKAYKRRAPPFRPVEERFWEKVNKNGPTQPHMTTCCWVWMGPLDSKGYGQLCVAGRLVLAHRLVWTFGGRATPGTQQVLHRCDTPSCVRYDHLIFGSHVDNMKDMATKKRSAHGARGSNLTEEQARSIVEEVVTGRSSQAAQALLYNISTGSVSRIVHGVRWPHLKRSQ